MCWAVGPQAYSRADKSKRVDFLRKFPALVGWSDATLWLFSWLLTAIQYVQHHNSKCGDMRQPQLKRQRQSKQRQVFFKAMRNIKQQRFALTI